MKDEYSESRITWYEGHRYDSWLEAKWGALFDGLGIRFVPHPATFSTGKRTGKEEIVYTPDFYLCDYNRFCEAKPDDWALSKYDIQRKISAAMDHNHTPIGHGLMILGAMNGFYAKDFYDASGNGHLCLGGEYYQWTDRGIAKGGWRMGALEKGSPKVTIAFTLDDENFQEYPCFAQEPKANLWRSGDKADGASHTLHRVLFDVVHGEENGLFTFENEEVVQDVNKESQETTDFMDVTEVHIPEVPFD